jgi:hypothetical protein
MPLDRDDLVSLVSEGLSIKQIASKRDVGASTVRYWLAKFELKTRSRRSTRHDGQPGEERVLECRLHGSSLFIWQRSRARFICRKCRYEHVKRRRHKIRRILIDEAGGCCRLCGYDKCIRALDFHHLDPATKEFSIGSNRQSASLSRLRVEARKCVLLCNRCHAEVEAGVTKLPIALIQTSAKSVSVSGA